VKSNQLFMRFKKELEDHYITLSSEMSLNGIARHIQENDPLFENYSTGYLAKELSLINIKYKSDIPPFKRLFLDIETSPNVGWFWRSSYKVNIGPEQIIDERRIISVSWKWEGENKVYHMDWGNEKCDKRIVEKLSLLMDEADEVVTHNGDRFDIPWLRTRALYHGVSFNTYIKSLDTLKKVKASFNFQSNKLDYIASFLGLGHKKPSGIGLWITLTFGNPNSKEYKEALALMHEYCDHDVVLLEDVFVKIQPYIKPVSHVGIAKKQGRHSCPHCASTNIHYKRHTVTPTGIVKRHMGCNDCDGDYIIPNTVYGKWLLNEL